MVVAALLFALMGVFVKLGSATLSSVELVFWRSLFGVVLIGVPALARRQRFATPNWPVHLRRGVVAYCSLLGYFYAIVHLPLSTAVTLNYTSPMFLALLSVLLLRERLRARALAAGFAGVVLLLKPTLAADAWLAGVLGLSSGLLAGWSYLQVRELGRRGEPEWRVVFFFALVSTVGGALLIPLTGDWQVPDADAWLAIAGVGLTATLAQLAMTRAYKVGSKLFAANLSYLTVVFSTLLGVGLWGEPLPPSSIAAIVLIVVSGIVAGRR
ncbi:DMT family transporter [Crenobacter sp. HX-7-9]|uniref:DMT family transporter n=2 Tax=Crenobacter caeni TaxID=2705474 RepID=A0A6B2KSG4_9NEIS|nr:DMT family transporter [Crenobacter caeni]